MAFAISAAVTYFAATAATSTYVAMALYASTALQVIGGVTKNEDLQKLGAVVGIGAGIYGAATGAFGAEVAGEAATDNMAGAIDPVGSETALDRANAATYGAGGETVTGTVAPPGTPIPNIDPTAARPATSVGENAAKAVSSGGVPSVPPTTPTPPVPSGGVPPSGGGIFGGFNLKDPQTLYGTGLIMQGVGPAISGLATGNTEEDKLEFLRQQDEAKQAELARRARNFNFTNVDLGVRPSGVRPYSAPRPLINPYRSPVLPT